MLANWAAESIKITLGTRDEGQSVCLPVAVKAPNGLKFETHPSSMKRQLNVTWRHSAMNLVILKFMEILKHNTNSLEGLKKNSRVNGNIQFK